MKRTRRTTWLAMALAPCVAVTCALAPGCGGRNPGPDLQIVGESTRVRAGDLIPTATPWFDGATVTLMAARGETIGIQVLHRGGGAVTLAVPGGGVTVTGFAVDAIAVTRPSTALYGGSHGAGSYADGLTPAVVPATDPAYFEIRVDAGATAGGRHGELAVGGRKLPVTLSIAPVVLPPLARTVWAYEDPRELGDGAERPCIDMFARYGVLLTPDIKLADWPARQPLLAGATFVPVILPEDPAAVGPVVAGWLAATAGTGQVPFAIPIDEPRTPEARKQVRALADAVRAAGGGPGKLLYAVTDEPRPEYRDAVDLYITLRPHLADRFTRWTYNGAPPRAGAMVLDAETPGVRTWGVIGWRYKIPIWYVWDALYWHDRHNKKRALDVTSDPTSFDDGEDHGNLDGVLALPGCRPTLRLAALRRGLYDRALLDAAARCDPARTEQIASQLVPRALGDAEGEPAWPTNEASWELARRRLIELASCADRARAPR